MRFLRSVLRISLLDRVRSDEMRQQLDVYVVGSMVKAYILRQWMIHLSYTDKDMGL